MLSSAEHVSGGAQPPALPARGPTLSEVLAYLTTLITFGYPGV